MSDVTYLIDLFNEMREQGLEGTFSENTEETRGKIDVALGKLEVNSDLAKQTLLERIGEKDLVIFMLMIQKMITTLALTKGDKGILFAEMSGELQAYTQTVLLATIGTLIQDEIL